jgi:H+-transporting ATPase
VDNLSDEFARKGYRTLGVARTDDSGRCSYLGLLALYDPPRDDSAETIKTAESMGLEIKMVTGDHLAIAREIAREVHLGTNIITAETFAKESDSDATNTIEQADGFDAIRESRRIFQRMNNYVIYRIAETIRVLFFITLSILIFNFFPITALMIVLLALFNDIPIMTIAYDNVLVADRPVQWKMREIITISTIIGFVGVIATFIILYIAQGLLHLSLLQIQTFIFLKLAVAGSLTILVSRTRGHFWSIRPGSYLLWAVVSTKVLLTLFAVYGIFMVPIGWPLAIFVWLYAIVEELAVMDYVKVWSYDLIDHHGIRFHR